MAKPVQDIIKALEEYAASLEEKAVDGSSMEAVRKASDEMASFFGELRQAVSQTIANAKAPYPDPTAPDGKGKRAADGSVSDYPYPDKEQQQKKAQAAEQVVAAATGAMAKAEVESLISQAVTPLQSQLAQVLKAVEALAVKPAEVAKSEPAADPAKAAVENALPTETSVDQLAKAVDPSDQIRAEVAAQMRRMGFIPSAPSLQRTTLGMEKSSLFAKSASQAVVGDEEQLAATIVKMREITSLPFSAINRLRTQVGAW